MWCKTSGSWLTPYVFSTTDLGAFFRGTTHQSENRNTSLTKLHWYAQAKILQLIYDCAIIKDHKYDTPRLQCLKIQLISKHPLFAFILLEKISIVRH